MMDHPNVFTAINRLVDGDELLTSIFSKYLNKKTWSSDESQAVINRLSDILWNEKYTEKVAELFTPILLELLTRASNFSEDSTDFCVTHEWFCICLSKLIWNYPEVGRFARMYFEKRENLFLRYEADGKPPNKKRKTSSISVPLPYQLLKAAYLFLLHDTPYFKDQWSWSVIVQFLKDADVRARWYAIRCLGHVVNIKDSTLCEMLEKNMSHEEYEICAKEALEMSGVWNRKPYDPRYMESISSTQLESWSHSLAKATVNVYGVLLSKANNKEISIDSGIVPVANTIETLHSLALAVSSAEPVLLQGPVGCGKTSLVQEIALMTGRQPVENFLKIQLGDHVDSKMLLGAHICTEIPGQFVWKPGILIRAMTEGHWLLLEDIDCAPMDVVSLLVPVLQSRSIILPGRPNPVKAAPGFQLFATQRLLSGLGGSYLEFRNNADVIDKQWRKLMVSPLSKEELTQVISTKWPVLKIFIPHILTVYSDFSADLSELGSNSNGQGPLNSHLRHGRLISMRDLFKFCDRIAPNFQKTKDETKVNALRHAIDCFCDSIPDPMERLKAVHAICNRFGLDNNKGEYFCQNHKPNIENSDPVVIGQIRLPKKEREINFRRLHASTFAHTRQALALLEKVATCIKHKEPVLLVGETGTGKTSIVQYLAELTNQTLTVINMSQQSDSVDLVGGYKPVELIFAIRPVKDEFETLFPMSMDAQKNSKFLQHISNCFYKRQYKKLFALMLHAQKNIVDLFRKKNDSHKHLELIQNWNKLGEKIKQLQNQMKQARPTVAFQFIEGALVKAMKNGEWLLLDEINLAEAETLECLAGVLEKEDSLILLEKGDSEPIKRHPDFHIFACMNPATDVGKKDLPAGIRSRFTEFFVEEVSNQTDLMILVHEYLKSLAVNNKVLENIVQFYQTIKTAASKVLNDGSGHHPHYSLRTLCRALRYASSNPCHNVPRSLYEAFCLSFLSQLDNASHQYVTKVIKEGLLGDRLSVLKQSIPEPRNGNFIQVAGYWILKGTEEPSEPESYIFTETVQRNLHDLARIVSAGRFPVLLQGETSSGKTSLIQYLAKITGNVCLRVNNHEHTDIQEYVGSYSADDEGNLVFREGILVEAMRNGYWIILDELNLAPTEVMEALNRVLDDNRELFISETQEVVKAQPGFMIFATQNPPGHYGGRKILSRAFRNRFIELHFNEIPPPELEVILEKRCRLSRSHSKKLVAVMQELQMRRRESGVFAGKQGFITLRDLFRWGERYDFAKQPDTDYYDWDQHLADEGFLLLAGRVRHPEEILVIQEAIMKHLKRQTNPETLFTFSENTSETTKYILQKVLGTPLHSPLTNIVWTEQMRRLAVLVGKAMQFNEPVLLIGNTGCGKTTMCQIFAQIFDRKLYSVNCHMHSESADFLGGLRPVRDAKERETKLFEWVDGPLIKAMNEGSYFLCDEISLADDSVLERLNSVLEQEQKILLTEKSMHDMMKFEITAKEGFQFFATMNPGGDYGKKELSPALRNRFTEIWCPSNISKKSDVIQIVDHNIRTDLRPKRGKDFYFKYGVKIADFLAFYSQLSIGKVTTITARDVLTWVEFINATAGKIVSPFDAYLHGAMLVFLDSIGSGQSAVGNISFLEDMRKDCFKFLAKQVPGGFDMNTVCLLAPERTSVFLNVPIGIHKGLFGIDPFLIDCGKQKAEQISYVFTARTTKQNALHLLRAMQLPKPILLEGSPGVGKTSLVEALARASGHTLVRINLSEQTDVSDLFGADLPVEGGKMGEFSWRDGPLLQALKNGHWILLDELNLASQSVLEGLNACLDHRSEIYISELGLTLHLNKSSVKIFACQNPYRQGGSRKGLPRSFLNRFTQVYVKPMEINDLLIIAQHMFPDIPDPLLMSMIKFNDKIESQVNKEKLWGHQGSPFEFNLRDVFRWCEAIEQSQMEDDYNIGEFVKLLYADRMRTAEDKNKVYMIYHDIMSEDSHALSSEHFILHRPLDLNMYEDSVQLGNASIKRAGRNVADTSMISVPSAQLHILESIMKCIEMNWMPILVGTSSSGKSSLVRLLAELSGQHLQILSVNSEMDTMELLGGFEQVDLNRKIESIAQDLEPIIQAAVLHCIHPSVIAHKATRLENILTYTHLFATIKDDISMTKMQTCRQQCMLDLIDALFELNIPKSKSVLTNCSNILNDMSNKINKGSASAGGQFEWVDSILIHAATRGHWLLIDDANFCSPSVLDRLNSLLEPNGVLTVSEQGVVGNELRTISPHPDFRIFLTMNPRNGEISRAMRNRGVEIFVDPINVDPIPWRCFLNIGLLAQCKGLDHSILTYHLFQLHNQISQEHGAASLSDFLSAASLFAQLLQRHIEPKSAFMKSCLTVYAKNNFNVNIKKAIVELINRSTQKFPTLNRDLSPPLVSLLPTTIDYRQNSLCASVKKHSFAFSYFLSHMKNLLRKTDDVDIKEAYFPYPIPNFNQTGELVYRDRFFCLIRLMIESCSVELYKLLDVWLQYTLEREIKNENQCDWKKIMQFCLQLKNVLSEQLNDPIVLELIDVVANICDHSGFTEVKKSEISIDPRWRPNLYRRLLFRFKQNCVNEGSVSFVEDTDMIDFKVSSCANKFSLLLLLRTLEFRHSFNERKPQSCSLLQTEKVSKLLEEKKRDAAVVHNIPGFLENVPHILLGILKKMDCPDDYYWKFRDILSSYYACRKVSEEPFRESAVYSQLVLFSAHFYWLWKKIKNIYDSEKDIPSSLQNCFKVIDRCLSFKNKEKMFRSKFGKKTNFPLGFVHQKAANIYINAMDVYKYISLSPRLNAKEPNLSDIKVIALNRRTWMSILSSQVYESAFSSLLENTDYGQGANKVQDIKLQLRDANLITSDNDDIMEICQNPAEVPNISNEKLTAHIQLMPLLDYIFNIYTAEILSPSTLSIDTRTLYKLGVEDICVNPKHLAHIFRNHIQANEFKMASLKEVGVLLMTSFLIHARRGFSSQGLKFLHCQLVEGSNGLTLSAPPIEWNTQSIWSKQAPLLTYICTSICDNSCNSAVLCHSPLKKFEEKVEQLEFTKSILWSNFEKLANPQHSLQLSICQMINLWFVNLIYGVAMTVNCNITEDSFSIEHLKELFEDAGVSSLVVSPKGIDVLALAVNSVRELNAAIKGHGESGLMWLSSKTYVYVGLLSVMLLLPRDAIDPAIKRNVKAQYYENKVQELIDEEGIHNWVSKVINGLTIEEVASLDCTPHLKNLLNICAGTKQSLYALNKKLVCREDDKFEEIKDVFWTCMKDICSPDVIIDTISQIDQVFHNNAPEKKPMEHDCILRALTLIQSQRHFVEQNSIKYWCYEDITMPFYLGMEQIMHGMHLARQSVLLKQMDLQFQNKHFGSIATFLSEFVSFPVDYRYNPLDMAGLLLDTDNMNSFKILLSLSKASEMRAAQCISKLLKSGVLEIINEIRMRPLCSDTVKQKVFTLLSSAMAFFWEAWDSQQMKIKQKQEEEESLYVHKVKHHEGELTEEEAIEKKIHDSFPSFRKAYSDCLESDEDTKESSLDNLAEELLLTPDDTFEIWQLHATVASTMLRDKLKNSDENMKWVLNKSKTLDFNTPYLLRYEVVCEIIKSMPDKLDGALDNQLVAGHLLMCNELQKIQHIGNQFYDIYHSPNPKETLTLKPMLNKLENHLKTLLVKYPEEPLLLQILKLVDRVLSFPITDPVMKFVVGLEHILEAMQSWRDILKEEKEEISKKIIQYRSLELDGWKKGLDSVIRKQYVNCSKWWFHLYGLVENLARDPEKKETCDTVIDSLKQFLEDSPLGEFPARISILHTFLQHTKLSQALPSYRKLSELLFNLYCYYEQFLPDVNNRIAQIRKPIDKELKDYVKIARWNDINFDALKQSVKKSHRFVVKHVKAFEDALKTPAKKEFTIPSKTNSDGSSWTLDIKEINFVSKSDENIKEEYFRQKSEELLQRIPRYYKRLAKFSRKLSKSFTVVNDVNILNEFCGTVIESLHSVTLDTEKTVNTRSKEKKQALLLIQKKKQMLSALFKNLKAIGLSFGHGRMFAKNVLKGSNILLTVPAFDCSQMEMLKFDKGFKELLSKASQDTSHYFYKSLAQYALLQKHMELPCKELTLDIIYRIDGYSGSLMYYIITQRQEIVQIAKNIDKIGCFLGSLSALQNTVVKNKCLVLPPENDVIQLEETLNNLNIRMMATIQQFGVLMNCAPRSFKTSFGEIPVIHNDPRLICSLKKGDLNWTKILSSITECATHLEKYFQQLLSSDPNYDVFATWEKFSQTLENFKVLATSVDIALSSMQKPHFNRSQQIVSSLISLSNEVHKEFKNAAQRYSAVLHEAKIRKAKKDDARNKSVSSTIQKLTKEVLLAYQDITTLCVTSDAKDSEDNICPENLFTARITTYLSNFEKYLRFQKIKKLVQKLRKRIKLYLSSVDDLKAIDDSLRLLIHVTPVMKQYFQLVKVYFATYLGMHRTSCKFLTIMLEIFNILATKGFCIPADLQEEAQKSGDTKFEDIESGGLDEGEGVKDVSENIETEDQLEDTLKEGQDKKEKEETDDIKDEEKGIEMSEDFEGKSYNPEKTLDESDTSDNEEEGEDLDKQMGDVDGEDLEKLDEKIWGSDSEDEDQEMNDANDTGGVSENLPSELAAKDALEKESDRDKSKLPKETLPEENNDEYQGNAPDPLIDAPPDQEPEVVELPDDMEITDDVDKEDGEIEPAETEEITYDPDEELEPKEEAEDVKEPEETNEDDSEKNPDKLEEDKEGEMDVQNGTSAEPVPDENEVDDEKNESNLPTHTPTTEKEALPSADQAKSSSHDPVQEDAAMDWESGAHKSDEQHEEGQADAQNEKSAAHEGARSSSKQSSSQEQQQKQKLKPPSENRTLDDNADNSIPKQRPIADKQSLQKTLGAEENADDNADVYEHVSNKEEGVTEAVDVATEEQAAMRPAETQNDAASDSEEIIELSSDEEEEYCNRNDSNRTQGDIIKNDSRQRPGEQGNYDDDESMDTTPEGEIVRTHTVSRGETTIHTQYDLWASMSLKNIQEHRPVFEKDLEHLRVDYKGFGEAIYMWKNYEDLTLNLAQELCEQLRLVLEPTKMSKLKGDYRTGKRLNMRKIIPYIASQFRKDKIWLRRTKPSKRQYQIMLAVDDSSSMADNHSKQLAFESLAVLGQSLSLLEAGELSVVSFGEEIERLLGFEQPFSTSAGAKMLQQLTFCQKKTNYAQLLKYATDVMAQSRNTSALMSKETAQLLVILSDGRGIFNEGKGTIMSAVREARDNNIFMVFIIIDSPNSQDSILDIKTTTFERNNKVTFRPYIEDFPFPFYIILRDISALPTILGGALRQWFELVTATER